jgi:hypothetical protein
LVERRRLGRALVSRCGVSRHSCGHIGRRIGTDAGRRVDPGIGRRGSIASTTGALAADWRRWMRCRARGGRFGRDWWFG